MSKEKQIEKKECKKCLHYEMCLNNFRGAKEEGFYELISEEEYFTNADECDFCAVGYRKQSEGENYKELYEQLLEDFKSALYQVWKIADRQVVAEPHETDVTDKCGSCEWAMPMKGSAKGVFGCTIKCQNPSKKWKSDISMIKQRTTPRCRLWEPKKEVKDNDG